MASKKQIKLSYHPKYKNYGADNKGNIYNIKTGRILKPETINRGYERVSIQHEKKSLHILVHRFIYECASGYVLGDKCIDHKNGNKLDNRMENLRTATRSQNMMNQTKWDKCTSKFKGVSWHKPSNKWVAKICKNRKMYHIGYFDDEKKAAQAYNNMALIMFGSFARINDV